MTKQDFLTKELKEIEELIADYEQLLIFAEAEEDKRQVKRLENRIFQLELRQVDKQRLIEKRNSINKKH